MTTRGWLNTIHGQSPGHFVVSAFTPHKVNSAAFTREQIDSAAATIDAAAGKVDVYVSCATFDPAPDTSKGERGKVSAACSIPGVWLDLDVGTEGHSDRANGLPNPETVESGLLILQGQGVPDPTHVIHTGGGAQLWWLFEQPLTEDLARFSLGWTESMRKLFEAAGYGLDSLGDLARILRPAGTFNHKLDEPRPVTLLQGGGLKYKPSELEPWLADVDLRAPSERESSEFIDSDIFDVFTSEVPWSEILEPHGWTYVGQSGKDEKWLRPDKSEGHSALCGRYAMTNFSETAGVPVGAGKKLTKFRVWAHLDHGGDEKAARRALAERLQK